MGDSNRPKSSASPPPANSPGGDASVQVRLNGFKEGETKPAIALYSVDGSGRAEKKLAYLDGWTLNIPPVATKETTVVALGPDVSNPRELPPELLTQYRGEQVAEAVRSGVWQVPQGIWPGWQFFNVCVSGKAEKCSLILWKALRYGPRNFRPPIVPRCAPLCNGIVEVYERICCCRWWIDPVDIDSLLDRLKYLVAVNPPFPPVGPGDPWEMAALDDQVALMRATAATPMGPVATALPMAPEAPFGAPQFDARAEILRIQSMPPEQAQEYVRRTDYLLPYCCDCSLRKIGEAVLNPDGTFSFCYYRPPIPLRIGFPCTFSYMYKVKQWDGNAWVYVYNGVALGQAFPANKSAMLETFSGHACDPGPVVDKGPYVMLENIGDTQSWHLVSQDQLGELQLGSVADNGGLVFPPAPMGSDLGSMLNCPWGSTLPFRLRFHPDITGPVGAMYYRISVVPTNDGMNPSGPAVILKTPIAWSYFQLVAGVWTVLTDPLGPNTVGGQQGLYLIPDSSKDWEWYQFHNYWDTTSAGNGRYFVVVEVFDAAGIRLKPAGAPGPGKPANFTFLKWEDATTLNDVTQADLVHLFWVDNLRTYAHIDDLRMDGVPNMAECQYLTGTCADTFSIGYRAFHATRNSGTPPETFMLDYEIWYTRGFGAVPPPPPGPEWGDINAPVTLGGGLPATSIPRSFCDMLGIMAGQHKKCTFAVNIYVWAKHWNGGGRLSQYDSSDQASFSLEV